MAPELRIIITRFLCVDFFKRRYYSSRKDSGEKESNTTNSESDDSSKPEGAEALMSILSSSPTTVSSDSTASASSKENNAVLILETFTKVTDRQQQATSCTANFLKSKMFLGGPGSTNAFLVQDLRASRRRRAQDPKLDNQAMAKLIEKVEEKNVQIQTLHVLMKGLGPGRYSAIEAICAKTNSDIKRISDTTAIPFNECRPPKSRRL
ncbi:hypothetical protein BGZ99_003077 [Dissophora globulifera]|uniref:Ribosomal protein S11 n=1 Tax=Dissophora globulifera TaxID=979702 RepID=A0A9P6RXW8_9FUNG|nr:hypothetical protein BGZ99_003077 [Dissophora globulifera]